MTAYDDSMGDLQAKVDALCDDMADAVVEGLFRPRVARAIAERHMLAMVTKPRFGVDVTADHLPVLDAAEMREVPLGQARRGDRVARTGVVTEVLADGSVWIQWGSAPDPVCLGGYIAGLSITRPAGALPDKPGSEAIATVHGTKGVRVVLAYPESDRPWLAINLGGYDAQWVRAADLSDWQPLVEGRDG